MGKRLGKKAQFYLIATVIITALVIGFFTVSNYSKTKNNSVINDLGLELELEGENLLNYGTIQGENKTALIEDLISKLSISIEEGIEIYILFGNQTSIDLYTYTPAEGVSSLGDLIVENINVNDERIRIEIHDEEYYFKLEPGENFYFIIYQDIEGEQHVYISESEY